ncbi:Extracellular exo-alpha-L-arabinofuranosidase [Streptomyces alboniger]
MWFRHPSPVRLRRLLAVLAPLLLVATFLGAQPADAATVDPNASYVLVNRNSGKALDLYNMATDDGARITQWTRNDQAQQQWQFVDSGGGYYRIKSRHSGKVLDVYNWSTANGGAIAQWTDLNATNQQWRLADSSDGYVRLISRHSNKALEVQGASTADSANIVQYDDWGGTNQQWQLVKVGGDTSGPCDLPSTYRWTSTGALAQPQAGVGLAQGLHQSSTYNGKHLVYATTHDTRDEGWGSTNFSPFTNWSDMAAATQNTKIDLRRVAPDAVLLRAEEHLGARLPVGRGRRFVLPHVERPHQPQRLVRPAGAVHREHLRLRYGGPSTQTLIADDPNMYLFFAGDNGKIYRASMPIGNFPGSFGSSYTTIMSDTTNNLFEAPEVYKVQGQNQYLMIVEAQRLAGPLLPLVHGHQPERHVDTPGRAPRAAPSPARPTAAPPGPRTSATAN